jgi:hypothetical protein
VCITLHINQIRIAQFIGFVLADESANYIFADTESIDALESFGVQQFIVAFLSKTRIQCSG